jgi:hypothetical protein
MPGGLTKSGGGVLDRERIPRAFGPLSGTASSLSAPESFHSEASCKRFRIEVKMLAADRPGFPRADAASEKRTSVGQGCCSSFS